MVMLMGWDWLCRGVEPKAAVEGVKVGDGAGTPVPDNPDVLGELLSAPEYDTESVADRDPEAVGEKVIPMLQFPPDGGMVFPLQVSLPFTKSPAFAPVTEAETEVALVLELFVNVKDKGEEDEPTVIEPKSCETGRRETEPDVEYRMDVMALSIEPLLVATMFTAVGSFRVNAPLYVTEGFPLNP